MTSFKPSLLLSETHAALRARSGWLPAVVERVAAEGFFRHIEITEIVDPADRRALGPALRAGGLTATCWFSLLLGDRSLSLCALDEDERRSAVACVREQVPLVAECGVMAVAVGSGPDPGKGLRVAATDQLRRSLCELWEAVQAFPGVHIVLEPLDREVHKKGLLGPTDETIALLNRVRAEGVDARLCWDSAHAILCGEDPASSLELAAPLVCQVHLANPVLDPTHPRYGDHHIPPGLPGVFDAAVSTRLFARAVECGLCEDGLTCVAVEMRSGPDDDPWDTVANCQAFLESTWPSSTED